MMDFVLKLLVHLLYLSESINQLHVMAQQLKDLLMVWIKDCSFKLEKTIHVWDCVFSEAAMDSLEQQWIDEKMKMDGLINAQMNMMDRWMDGLMDDGWWMMEGWWNGLWKERFKALYCEGMHRWHPSPATEFEMWLRENDIFGNSHGMIGMNNGTYRDTDKQTFNKTSCFSCSRAPLERWMG